MDFDVGSATWYILLLLAGLATGMLIQWIRKRRDHPQ